MNVGQVRECSWVSNSVAWFAANVYQPFRLSHPLVGERLQVENLRSMFTFAPKLGAPRSFFGFDYATYEPVQSFQSAQIPCTRQSNGVQIRANVPISVQFVRGRLLKWTITH